MATFDAPMPGTCPMCGYRLAVMAGLNHDDPPEPGSLSVCVGCRAVLIIDMTLVHRIPTREEWEEIEADPSTVTGLKHAQDDIADGTWRSRVSWE